MTTKPLNYIVNTVHAYKPRPDECADLFDAALAQAGLEYKVGWTWVGRCRHGIIYVLDKAGNVVLKQYWERQQTRWSQSDDNLRSCNFGSPKHQALVEVTHNVKALVSANAIVSLPTAIDTSFQIAYSKLFPSMEHTNSYGTDIDMQRATNRSNSPYQGSGSIRAKRMPS